MLGEYYMITGIGAFVCLVLAAVSGLFGRTLRKIFPGPRVLLFHKTSALAGAGLALLHVLGVHGF